MEIIYFKINGSEAEETGYLASTGERLKLSWKLSGCDACVIYPYNWQGGTEGSLEIYVYQPMTLLLRAYDKKGSVQKEIPVKINGKEQLESVGVSPKDPAKAGEKTTFELGLKNTDHGYLDHGIGRVEGSSYTQLLRDGHSVYRYAILSQSTGKMAFQEQAVKAGGSDVLALDRLNYVLMREGVSQTYRLDWRIVNHSGADVVIQVSGEPAEAFHGASGHKTFKREGGGVRTLSIQCRKDTGEEIHFSSIYPFEVTGR